MLRKLDWGLMIAVFILAACGLVTLASVHQDFFRQQLLWYAIGLVLVFVLVKIDLRPFVNYPGVIHAIYGLAVVLLVVTYFFAPTIRNVKGWLSFGAFQFQTSEFAKLALIILFSWFWAKAHIQIARLKNLGISLAYAAVPIGLVLLQPDMGSALILGGIWFGYLLVSGIKWQHLLAAAVVCIIGAMFLWSNYLANYQKDRILGLFYPERDPLGINYSVIQSKIAIGSAGWFGKGFGQGTQVQLGFLPEAQNDFVYAALVEEWGLIGGIVVLAAFAYLMIRLVLIGWDSENNFSRMLCLGAVIMFLLHFILNLGSVLGLLPVIGVPLPFMSAGGSNLLTSFLIIGIIQSIVVRSKF